MKTLKERNLLKDKHEARKEARAALRDILKALGKRYGSDLWDILSALRGPDNGHQAIKSGSTAQIRGRLQQWSKTKGIDGLSLDVMDFTSSKSIRENVYRFRIEDSDHFKEHIMAAIDAMENLGIIEVEAG